MNKYRKLAELLKSANHIPDTFFTGTVSSIEGNTCTVNVDGLLIGDVRLKPTTTTSKSMIGNPEFGYEIAENKAVSIPAVGSNVLLGSFSGDCSNLFVLQTDVVDKFEITCNGINLMKLISGLIQTITNAKVITPQGTGTYDPATIASLKVIEESFKEIFQ